MCDYSLHAVASRDAELTDTLVSSGFPTVSTRGFATAEAPLVAICLRPGTEIAFERNARTGGWLFRRNIGDRLATFRQIDLDEPMHHHDALEFSNGKIVLLTDLAPGQRARVIQLPATAAAGRFKVIEGRRAGGELTAALGARVTPRASTPGSSPPRA
jgi:hypothetical protein